MLSSWGCLLQRRTFNNAFSQTLHSKYVKIIRGWRRSEAYVDSFSPFIYIAILFNWKIRLIDNYITSLITQKIVMIILIFYFILLIDCGILLNGFVVIEMLAELGA